MISLVNKRTGRLELLSIEKKDSFRRVVRHSRGVVIGTEEQVKDFLARNYVRVS